jgi:hypothetical protein
LQISPNPGRLEDVIADIGGARQVGGDAEPKREE